ncbi:MAG: type VI-A CRISPR-associated RNA-guided ribonuclease Cas13a [Bacteroidaceae bacterium]|nr:type VI-A CRISPR-associated RNA-guided ribonuclease Cas13a [Bacteroidaceae bacterium]
MKITKVNNVKKAVIKNGLLYDDRGVLKTSEIVKNRVADANINTDKMYSVFKRSKNTNYINSTVDRILNFLRKDNSANSLIQKLNSIDIKINLKPKYQDKIKNNIKEEYNHFVSVIIELLEYKAKKINSIQDESAIRDLLEEIKQNITLIISARNIDNISKSIEKQNINYSLNKEVLFGNTNKNKSSLAYQDVFLRIKNDDLKSFFDIISILTKDICNKTNTSIGSMSPEILCFWKSKIIEYLVHEKYQDEKHKEKKESNIEKRIIGKINNLITAKLIEYGKILYHFTDDNSVLLSDINEISSFDLESIKAIETITKKINTSFVYATSIFSNILSYSIQNDTLMTDYQKLQNKRTPEETYIYMSKYFGGKAKFSRDFKINVSNIPQLAQEIQDILYKLRNQNFHYALSAPKSLAITKLRDIYNKDCESQPQYILDKYNFNNVFSFYDRDTVIKHIEKLYKDDVNVTPVFVPSFKNLFSKLQKDKMYMEWSINSEKIKNTKNINYSQTLHFILQDIYYNSFLVKDDFKSIFFEKALVLIETDVNKENEKAFWDFKDKYNALKREKDSISEFAKILTVEFNKQNADSKISDEKKLSHYSLILRQVLAKSFWLYINEHFKFILTPQYREYDNSGKITLTKLVENYKKVLSSSNSDQDILLAFYAIGKFIPAKELNFLKGDFLKYRQFIEDISNRQKIVKSGLSSSKFIENILKRYGNCNSVLKILSLCQQSNGIISSDYRDYYSCALGDNEDKKGNAKEEFAKTIAKFIDGNIRTFNDLKQWDNYNKYIDSENPKVFSQIEKSRMYFTYHIIEKIYKIRVSKTNIEFLANTEKLPEYAKFHMLNNKSAFSDFNQWRVTVTKLVEYMHIKNKVELSNIQKLSDLIIDIYSYLISWCYMWERDLEYFLLALAKIKNTSQKDVKNIFKYDGKSSGSKLRIYLSQSAYKNFILKLFFKSNDETIKQKIRNCIDHFNYFKTDNKDLSLMSLYNDMYSLLAYNKKLQNNVFPKLVSVLEDYKIVSKHKKTDKNQNLKLDFLSDEFVSVIPNLLNYPNTDITRYELFNKIFDFTYQNNQRQVVLKAKLLSDKCTYICPFEKSYDNNKKREYNIKPKKFFDNNKNKQTGFNIADILIEK